MRIAQSCAAEQPRATGAPAHTSPGTGAARAAAARSSVETQRELRAIVAPASELSDAIPPSFFLWAACEVLPDLERDSYTGLPRVKSGRKVGWPTRSRTGSARS